MASESGKKSGGKALLHLPRTRPVQTAELKLLSHRRFGSREEFHQYYQQIFAEALWMFKRCP